MRHVLVEYGPAIVVGVVLLLLVAVEVRDWLWKAPPYLPLYKIKEPWRW